MGIVWQETGFRRPLALSFNPEASHLAAVFASGDSLLIEIREVRSGSATASHSFPEHRLPQPGWIAARTLLSGHDVAVARLLYAERDSVSVTVYGLAERRVRLCDTFAVARDSTVWLRPRVQIAAFDPDHFLVLGPGAARVYPWQGTPR
ncbi:hypothetical protein ACFL6X_06130 [Candidatus Latescibacterota bacterium]